MTSGRPLTVAMPRGHYRPSAAAGNPIRIAVLRA